MDYFLPLIVGFLAAFIGLLAPSMLNMTAARTSIEKGRSAGIQFAAGASSLVFIQAYIALKFTKYLVANPDIIYKLKSGAVFVLFALAIFFFFQARKEFKAKGKQKKGNNFLLGMGMSSLNMLAIPFYLGIATWAEAQGWLILQQPYIMIFVVGAVLGVFTLFIGYVIFATTIAMKAKFIAQNINYILSVLFVILGSFTLYQVLSTMVR